MKNPLIGFFCMMTNCAIDCPRVKSFYGEWIIWHSQDFQFASTKSTLLKICPMNRIKTQSFVEIGVLTFKKEHIGTFSLKESDKCSILIHWNESFTSLESAAGIGMKEESLFWKSEPFEIKWSFEMNETMNMSIMSMSRNDIFLSDGLKDVHLVRHVYLEKPASPSISIFTFLWTQILTNIICHYVHIF